MKLHVSNLTQLLPCEPDPQSENKQQGDGVRHRVKQTRLAIIYVVTVGAALGAGVLTGFFTRRSQATGKGGGVGGGDRANGGKRGGGEDEG